MKKKPTPLTDFDLRQMDESWLSLLTPEQLQAVSVRLLQELKDTRDRLNQSPSTRSEAGTRAFALLASVIETCRKRSASSWTYIASLIAAARKGLTVPSLPAIPDGV